MGQNAWFSLFLFNGRKITINFTCLCFLQPTCDQVASLLRSCPLLKSLLPFIRSTVFSSAVLHVWKSVACQKKVLYCKRGSCPLGRCDWWNLSWSSHINTQLYLQFEWLLGHVCFMRSFRWQKYFASMTSMYIRSEISFRLLLFFPIFIPHHSNSPFYLSIHLPE